MLEFTNNTDFKKKMRWLLKNFIIELLEFEEKFK